ncbi:MAG: ATP phosphoribosyltransferase regulatory subunit [Lachnospiraceae bacterium]|nr:ATP phosphoribosyltransferase regulatory subunit [Lachnospiraceae bacterium]
MSGNKDNRLLHTPEGVRDIYGDEMLKKLSLERKLKDVISSYGYRDIQTPSFEFFDIFSREIGTTPSREIYKFFDNENNTLSLRPDFTPGVARAAVKYFMEEKLPIRLCYLGNTFSNRSDFQGKLKEITELGAEYMGDPSVDADAEMIELSVKLLKTAGLTDFQICIGTAEYFMGLCDAAGLDEETKASLSDHIRNKNYFGTLDILNDIDISPKIRDTLSSFSDFFGNAEILDEALVRVKDIPRSRDAIQRLKDLYERLQIYGVDSFVTFDLGMLSRHHYYTGILFRAYTFGTGEPIIRGGRYDNLLGQFGKPGAAIGFTVVIEELLNILRHQRIEIPFTVRKKLVFYDSDSFKEAVGLGESIRKEGYQVELLRITPDCSEEQMRLHGKSVHAEKILVLQNGKETELELD